MLPVVALVGRPNVGKSTLFNHLTRTQDALVADVPGLTRDRQYGFGRVGPCKYLVVDTGGLSGDESGLDGLMAQQTLKAVEEADHVIFLMDGRQGLTSADRDIALQVRKLNRPVYAVVNKSEGIDEAVATSEFHVLGLPNLLAISATQGHNVAALMNLVLIDYQEVQPEGEPEDDAIKVAVIGRPNVGKSTLINRLLGEERLIAFDKPGTTRDAVSVPFESEGQRYVLIDTAGVRRRSKVDQAIEKYSVIKTVRALEAAHVVIAVLDASESITDQDTRLMGLAVYQGRALVVAVNKWDGRTATQRETVKRQLDLKLPFLSFADTHFISALHGTGVGHLMASVNVAFAAATKQMATPELTRALELATQAHQPPLVKGRRIRLRYAHQGGRNPPLIVIHGNQTSSLPKAYKRYLINFFRKTFSLIGTPVRLELRSGDNPYAGRRNKLTPRQERKRKRLLQHNKKRSK